jgi:hypothetical protein
MDQDLFGKMPLRQNLFGKIPLRQNASSAKCLFGKTFSAKPFRQNFFAKPVRINLFGKTCSAKPKKFEV